MPSQPATACAVSWADSELGLRNWLGSVGIWCSGFLSTAYPLGQFLGSIAPCGLWSFLPGARKELCP